MPLFRDKSTGEGANRILVVAFPDCKSWSEQLVAGLILKGAKKFESFFTFVPEEVHLIKMNSLLDSSLYLAQICSQ